MPPPGIIVGWGGPLTPPQATAAAANHVKERSFCMASSSTHLPEKRRKVPGIGASAGDADLQRRTPPTEEKVQMKNHGSLFGGIAVGLFALAVSAGACDGGGGGPTGAAGSGVAGEG